MDGLFLLFLIYSLGVYFTGFIFGNKPFEFLFGKKWPDLVFFLLSGLVLISIGLRLWKVDEFNAVQVLIFAVMVITLIYEGFLKNTFRKYTNHPIINIVFNDSKSEYFHSTLMRIATDILIQQGNSTSIRRLVNYVPAYYARLKVVNTGNTPLENAEVIVEKVEPKNKTKLLRPVMPLNLYWAFAEGEERRKINIPPHDAYRIIDFIELMNPQKTDDYTKQLNPEDVDYNRYKALTSGFRICSVPPNTLSDVFEKGRYIFTIGIYSSNFKPLHRRLSVEYDGVWSDNTEEMSLKHFRVELLDNKDIGSEIVD